MSAIKKIGFGAVVLATLAQQTYALNFGASDVKAELKGSTESADGAIQTLIGRAIGFLYILAVVYGLWGGFNIMTAGGDDEKVKKGKTIIIQALIGLVVIFLANSIVSWILGLLVQ